MSPCNQNLSLGACPRAHKDRPALCLHLNSFDPWRDAFFFVKEDLRTVIESPLGGVHGMSSHFLFFLFTNGF